MKGKHAEAASARRDRLELAARAERAEAKLTRTELSLAAANDQLAQVREAWADESRRLAADRDAVTSPLVRQLESQVDSLRAANAELADRLAKLQAVHDRVTDRQIAHLVRHEGMTPDEAFEALLEHVTGEQAQLIPVGMPEHVARQRPDAAEAIAQVRRKRTRDLMAEDGGLQVRHP